jgi:two-component system, LytTR family, sensor kinase
MPDSPEAIDSRTSPVRIDWRIAVAAALVMTLVFATQSINLFGPRQSFATRFVNNAINWGLWLALLPLVFSIASLPHTRRRVDVRTVVFQIAAAIAVPVIHGALLATVRWMTGTTNANGFYFFSRVVVALNFPGDLLRYCLIAATYHALAYYGEARRRDVAQAQLAQRLAEARLESLEARLQPHFLFNALNAIAALIKKDPSGATLMVGQLSDLLRAALNGDVAREVTLAGELRLLDQYVAIQRARFSDRLTFSIDAPPETLGAYVPQMLLQPIVENAIHHGIGPRESPGRVSLHATRANSTLRLVVRDDGVGYGSAPASLKGTGLGLRSTQARLTHFYGNRFVFDIRAASPTGTVVTIDLPFHSDAPRATTPAE